MLREFASIYGALARMGIGQQAAREMELWVVGAALGLTDPKPTEAVVNGSGRMDITPELLAARAKARAEGKRLADLPQPSLRRN